MSIQSVAQATGHSEADVAFHINFMASLIAQDGAAETYINADEATRMEFVSAYSAEVSKRITRVCSRYLTDSEVQDVVNSAVYDLIKQA